MVLQWRYRCEKMSDSQKPCPENDFPKKNDVNKKEKFEKEAADKRRSKRMEG